MSDEKLKLILAKQRSWVSAVDLCRHISTSAFTTYKLLNNLAGQGEIQRKRDLTGVCLFKTLGY